MSSSDSEEWIEKSPEQKPLLQREKWMETSFEFLGGQSTAEKRELKKRQEREANLLDKPGSHKLELNPYWRSGGSGLPSERDDYDPSSSSKPINREKSRRLDNTPSDGGVSWLRKALVRCKEQAEEENISVEEVAALRWGSLETLMKKLNDAEHKAGLRRTRDVADIMPRKRKPDEKRSFFRKPESSSDYTTDNNSKNTPRNDRHHSGHRDPSWRKKSSQSRETVERESHEMSDSKRRSSSNQSAITTELLQSKPQQKSFARESQVESGTTDNTCNLDNVQVADDMWEQRAKEIITEEETLIPLTQDERNQLSARILKAEMMGDTAKVNKLKKRLAGKPAKTRQPENVLLTKVTHTGVEIPLRTSSDSKTKDSIKHMAEREKFVSPMQQQLMFSKSIDQSKLQPDFDIDEVEQVKRRRKLPVDDDDNKQDAADKRLAILEHKKRTTAMDKCKLCFEKTLKHLVLAVGEQSYLCLPSFESLVAGHCLLVPSEHTTASPHLDEHTWSEMQDFKKALVRHFSQLSPPYECVFIESCKGLDRFPHLGINCIPLCDEDASLAPMYFKKAILESEGEWAQNKKLIELKSSNHLRKAIPACFPYFAVTFGTDYGFAHVIENENNFPAYFGLEVIGGMLDLSASLWRNPKKESFEHQCEKVKKFKETFGNLSNLLQPVS